MAAKAAEPRAPLWTYVAGAQLVGAGLVTTAVVAALAERNGSAAARLRERPAGA